MALRAGTSVQLGQPPSVETSAPLHSAVMHEHVYGTLRDAMMNGQLAPGRTLSVRRLASEFGVSAMPAREAIRRLVAMGALELTDTRRIKVAQMTPKKLEEVKLARLALEPLLAERVLGEAGRTARGRKQLVRTLKDIDDALDRAIQLGDVTEYARCNSQFHFALYRAGEAPVVLGLIESLWMQFGPFMRIVIGRLGTSGLVDDHHKEMLAAIEANQGVRLREAVHRDILQGMDHIDRVDFN